MKLHKVTSGNTSDSAYIAHFRTGVAAPLKSLKVSFAPVQTGTGNPSPTNVRPITGRTSLGVTRCGKNLYDAVKYPMSANYYITGSTGAAATTSNNYSGTADYVPCEHLSGQTVTLPRPGGNHPGVAFYSSKNKDTFISGESSGNLSTAIPITVTVPSTAKYMRLSAVTGEPTQLELGSEATIYEPYTASTVSVDWQSTAGTLYGGVLDLTTGVLTATTVMETFDGSSDEDWRVETVTSGINFWIPAASMPQAAKKDFQYGDTSCMACNQATARLSTETYAAGQFFFTSLGTLNMNIGTLLGITTVDAFRTYLASNPLQIVYELETPLTYSLSPATINTLVGTNNIWTTDEGCSIEGEYYDNDGASSLMEIRRQILMASDRYTVPPAYKALPYLEAHGDRAIIDTGVSGYNDNLRFGFKFNVDRFIQYRGLFTNYGSETANCWRLSESVVGNFIHTHNTKTGSSGNLSAVDYSGKSVKVNMDKTSINVTIDGTTYTNTAPTTAGTANTNNIVINSSRRYARTSDDNIRWYYFKIWDNGVLIRNYVPVRRKSDGVVGFYDTVNHVFMRSTGTEDFTAPDITDVPASYTGYDYLLTSGYNARIDTGIAGNDTTLEMTGDVKVLQYSQYHYIFGNSLGESYKLWRCIHPSTIQRAFIGFGTSKNASIAPYVPAGTWENPFRFQFYLKHGYAEVTFDGVKTSAVSEEDDGKLENSTNIAIGSSKPDASNNLTIGHQIYSFKIWKQGQLVRDYRPCVRNSDSKAGFYDMVNNSFNPSIGSVEFVAGNDE